MIDLDGRLAADGEALPNGWISGLTDRLTVVGFGDTYASIDLKLSCLGGYTLTGLPLSELTGACVPFELVFGAAGRELVNRVRDSDDWDARFDLIEAFLLTRMVDGPQPDPAVAWAWERLRASHGGMRVEALVAEVGCGRRYLRAPINPRPRTARGLASQS